MARQIHARASARNEPVQLELALAIDHAPRKVREHGLQAAHPRPLVSLGKRPDRPFRSFRVSPRSAWRFPEIELGRAGSSIAALVVDCDNPRAWRAGLGDLPPPSWIVRRPANDHAHIAWTLARPVHRYPAARPEPVRFLARIEEFYAATLGADPGYAGVLAHNPAPVYRRGEYRTEWGARPPYSLDALANVIPFGWTPPRVPRFAIGRNVELWTAALQWAGKEANRNVDALAMLIVANAGFADPLPHGELADMARRIERYRQQWAARGWHCPKWIERQAARRRKAKGRAVRASASRQGSNEALKPWEAEGISRRTWYRRRKSANRFWKAMRNLGIRLAEGTNAEIAARFGVSIDTVRRVRAGGPQKVALKPTRIRGPKGPLLPTTAIIARLRAPSGRLSRSPRLRRNRLSVYSRQARASALRTRG